MNTNEKFRTGSATQSDNFRAPYKSPAVLEYGSLREVTLTVANKNKADGPAGGNTDRTS